MKPPFAWEPLMAPANFRHREPFAARIWPLATAAAALFLIAGIFQTALGLSVGPAAYLPLLLSFVLFGLSHGAVDHLVLLGLARKALKTGPLLLVISGYLALSVAVVGFWKAAPTVAVFGFLLLTIYHWGQGDLAFDRLYRPSLWLETSSASHGIFALLRGIIPIGLPFVAFPREANAFVEACTALFSSVPVPGLPLIRTGFLLLICVLGTLHVLTQLLAFRRSRKVGHLHVLLESIALTAFFVVVPPLVAIGWYFCGWHSFRHVLRLCTYEPQRPDGQPRIRFARFFLQAAPFTVAAIGLTAILLLLVGDFGAPNVSWLATSLVAISAFTVPHACVVEWMDRREFSPDAR